MKPKGLTPKQLKEYKALKKYYIESGRRIAKKYIEWERKNEKKICTIIT